MTKQVNFRKRYNEEQAETAGNKTAIDFTGVVGKTIQEPAEDADINVLMKRMGVKDGSALPHFPVANALWGDFSLLSDDPTEIANALYEGKLAFMRLPADLRKRYDNPEELFKFMNDDKNYEEAVKLGLLAKKEPPVKSDIDKLVEKMDTLVSSSTSSDKEQLVHGANAPKPKQEPK